MRNLLFCSFLLFVFPNLLYAQGYIIKGKVTDSLSAKPLPFVNISTSDKSTGTATDIDGNFELTLPDGNFELEFSFIGYHKKTIQVNEGSKYLKVSLKEMTSELQEVSIFPGENPAHRIIKNTVAHRKKNNPENLESFSYRTYSKFTVSLDTDTVADTFEKPEANDSLVSAINAQNDSSNTDSADFDIQNFLENNYIFMSETVTERKYLRSSRDNETVLASRTSGFKNPLFALLTTQLQSFSFYTDYVSIAGSDFLNPITPGSTNRYFFLLEDTIYNSATDTVFIISFRPRPNYGFQPLKGLLYINTSSWAIQNVIAEPVEQDGVQISIEQRYKPYGTDQWFPDQLRAEIHFGVIELNALKPTAHVRTYLSEVQIGAELQKKKISKAVVTIDELAGVDPEKVLQQYRTDSISAKEARSYAFIDSLSEEADLEKRFNYLAAAASGRLPIWYFDLDLNKILKYNTYEGFRLGIGAHTNARFSRWIKLGGFVGYGFNDKVTKYGYDAEITINKYNNVKLKGGYLFDIFETGGVEFIQDDVQGLFNDNYRQLFIRQWDESSRYFASLSYDPAPQVHLLLKAQRENTYTVGDYYYNTENGQDKPLQNGFNYFEIVAGLNWTPKQKYIETQDLSKLLLERVYPLIDLQYTRGIAGVFDSDFDYNKIDLRVEQRYKMVRLGVSSIEIGAGVVFEDVPYSKLYAAKANNVDGTNFWKSFTIADRHSFETMNFNEFVSDTYTQVLLRHDFKSLLFRRENFAPELEIVARGLWGTLRSPDRQYGLSSQSPSKGYYEAGIETNKLLKNNFLSLGLGFYYRIGEYAFPDFEDNFALKITSKYSL